MTKQLNNKAIISFPIVKRPASPSEPTSMFSLSLCMHTCMLSHVQLCTIPWTVVCQATLFMGFSRQEYLHGLPFPPPGDLPNAWIELSLLRFLLWQTDSLALSYHFIPLLQFVEPVARPSNSLKNFQSK